MAKKKISNFNTKILSLAIAIFIWGFVAIFVNPEITRKYNHIPVIIQNSETLKDKDLQVLTNMKDININITIQGKRTSIAKIDKSEIAAYVDANSLKSGNKTYQIKYSLPYEDLRVTSQNDGVKINVDKIVEKRVLVKLNKIGNNSNLHSIWLDNYALNIKGISKYVKSVDSIVIDFNVAGIKESKKFQIGYKFVAQNGNVLNIKPADLGLPETLSVNVSIR